MNKTALRLSLVLLTSLSAGPGWCAVFNLAEALAQAKPGDTVMVPEGVFQGPLVLPPEVSLRGAGIEKTIFDAGGAEAGVLLKNSRAATLANFTVQGASMAGLRIEGGSNITCSSLRVLRSFCGVNVRRKPTAVGESGARRQPDRHRIERRPSKRGGEQHARGELCLGFQHFEMPGCRGLQ